MRSVCSTFADKYNSRKCKKKKLKKLFFTDNSSLRHSDELATLGDGHRSDHRWRTHLQSFLIFRTTNVKKARTEREREGNCKRSDAGIRQSQCYRITKVLKLKKIKFKSGVHPYFACPFMTELKE